MSPQHEIDRLNWNVAGLEVNSFLARVCAPAPKPEPVRATRAASPWLIASICVLVVAVMAFSAWRTP